MKAWALFTDTGLILLVDKGKVPEISAKAAVCMEGKFLIEEELAARDKALVERIERELAEIFVPNDMELINSILDNILKDKE